MSMSKRTVKYILMLLGMIILLAVYFLVYTEITAKTDALNSEISTLNNRLDQLNSHNEKVPSYKSAIEENRVIINDTLSRYYSANTPEDFIMFATDLEETVKITISTLSFSEPELIYSMMGVKETSDYTVPAEPLRLDGYKVSSVMDGSMNYEQMKTTLEFIYSQPDVTTLDSLNFNYDSSTGLILGSFAIDKYFITGRDIQEHQAVVPYTDFGKSVLVGS